MSGINNIVVDTNVLIYYLKGYQEVEKYFTELNPILSFVNELELLSGAYFYTEELKQISAFLDKQLIIGYLPELKDIIVRLRANKKLKLPDAIIAATAIYLECPLVSSDKGYTGIRNLDFVYHEPTIS